VNLENKAALNGVEGGAVSGANREVLSDFAGKRANLARDTRVSAELSKQEQKMQAMKAAGDYFGKQDDRMFDMLRSQVEGGGGGGGDNGRTSSGLNFSTAFGGTTGEKGRTGGTNQMGQFGFGAFGEGTGGGSESGFGTVSAGNSYDHNQYSDYASKGGAFAPAQNTSRYGSQPLSLAQSGGIQMQSRSGEAAVGQHDRNGRTTARPAK
jgi:hypothetical protein